MPPKKTISLTIETRRGQRVILISFEIHLPGQRTDLWHIQELLAHSSSKTTEIQTHVSKRYIEGIKNPPDDIFHDSHDCMFIDFTTEVGAKFSCRTISK